MKADSQIQTQKRRAAQPLFNALDNHLSHCLGRSVALAVSGGLDSRALMEAVAHWPRRRDFKFLVVVVNHQLRTEAGAEAEAVFARARALGFDCEIRKLFLKQGSDESCLRQARYESMWAFLKTRGVSHLCTAHQKDDDAEGVVMDLFGFGGGQHGRTMGSIAEHDSGVLMRPFLGLKRQELSLFLASIGITNYFCDPSNEDGSSFRQKARDFIRKEARFLHPKPIDRLSRVANRDISTECSELSLKVRLQELYREICPERDPRDAALVIDLIAQKARSFSLMRPGGVDPGANSITVGKPGRLSFDLPGAKVLMTPAFLSLYRNQPN